MRFNFHGNLEGRHAFLSPSSYSWIRYDEEHLLERIVTKQAAALGSKKHQYAHDAIKLGIKQASNGNTLNSYINDVIGYRMTPEQMLYFSENCFGTADALGFRANTLRIFDLKTGISKASVDQLLIYGALFFLEYGDGLGLKPFDIKYDFRIYQYDEPPQLFEVDPRDIVSIMSTIKTFDKIIKEREAEEEA